MTGMTKEHALDCWYWCAVCDQCIEGDAVDNRHTAPDGLNDCHDHCCPTCNE